MTIQGAVDKLRDSGGNICLQAGQYVLGEAVRIDGAKALRITGQGTATIIAAPASAFVVVRSFAIVLERMEIYSLGMTAACVSVRTVFGLTLRDLAMALFDNTEAQGAAISLAGTVFDVAIDHNKIRAPDGIRALDAPKEEGPAWLAASLLRIDDNLFVCRDSAIKLDGVVGHAALTRIRGNVIVGPHEVGISALGVGLPGASIEIAGNSLQVHGPAIRCAVGGAWIVENKLHLTQDGDRNPIGAGIELATGLDPAGSGQAHVLANQVAGFPEAGIVIATGVRDLIVQHNTIEQCGNGILMVDLVATLQATIADNTLRDIGCGAAGTPAPGSTVAIGILRTAAARVTGNHIRRVGLDGGENSGYIAGIAALTVARAHIAGNDIIEVVTQQGSGGTLAGILIRAPFARAEVHHNQVERDDAADETPSDSAWYALHIGEVDKGRPAALSRLGAHATLRLDEQRTLVIAGSRAFVHAAVTGIDPATGGALAKPGASASVLGNVLIARGRVHAALVGADGEILFSDNRCELRANTAVPAVRLDAPVAVISANRVRNGGISIQVTGDGKVAAIGNITTGGIAAPLPPEMLPLNLIG